MEESTETLSLLLNEKCADPVHENTKEKLIEGKQEQLLCSFCRVENSWKEGED